MDRHSFLPYITALICTLSGALFLFFESPAKVTVPQKPRQPGYYVALTLTPNSASAEVFPAGKWRIEEAAYQPAIQESQRSTPDVDDKSVLKVEFESGRVEFIETSLEQLQRSRPSVIGEAIHIYPSNGATLDVLYTYIENKQLTNSITAPNPFIFHGSVDIEGGPLTANHSGYTEIVISGKVIERIGIGLLESQPARGPPDTVRQVFVLGHINNVKLPDQLKSSYMSNRILDLSASTRDLEQFDLEVKDWEQRVNDLESQHGLPRSALQQFEGQVVEIKATR
jgi:hypothetical protein